MAGGNCGARVKFIAYYQLQPGNALLGMQLTIHPAPFAEPGREPFLPRRSGFQPEPGCVGTDGSSVYCNVLWRHSDFHQGSSSVSGRELFRPGHFATQGTCGSYYVQHHVVYGCRELRRLAAALHEITQHMVAMWPLAGPCVG